MHDVRVAVLGDHVLAPAATRRPCRRRRPWLGLGSRIAPSRSYRAPWWSTVGSVEQPAQHRQPLLGALVAGVVHVERHAVLRRLVRPPGRDHVEADPAGRDQVQRGQCLGGQRRARGSSAGPRASAPACWVTAASAGAERPGVRGRRAVALDVVEVQLGDQGQVEARAARSRPPGRAGTARRPASPRPRRCAASRRTPASSSRTASLSPLARFSVRCPVAAACRGPR